ncbi:TIM-barrel domain-containing protein [uncultured Bacteroides sp.]|uniref:TIM-barrel domain-containing protein n=1 Tax=uncultured Bacteroides sp. TaxID=162156 RepID=UPI002AA8502C|nr:TIM-barrel domain-containing protein [uncultured Bacteroides sp.]
MVKKYLLVCLLAISSVSFIQAGGPDKLIGKNVSVFYPKNYDAKSHQPSFALLKEPIAVGDIPRNWDLKPRFYSKDGKTYATLPITKGTSLYGTGENTGSLLRNGKNVTLWNTDNYEFKKDGGKRLYQSHPWVLGVNSDGTAFGVIADNTWKQHVDLTDSIRFISDGPAFRVIVIKRNSPQEVIKVLAGLVGKIALPPLWSLGYQQCRFSYVPDTRIKSVADTFRIKKLPCDVIWMDIDYMDHFKVFTFDKEKIPNPKEVNDYLHNKGFKSIWMIDPGVKAEKGYFVYDSGSKGNHWVQDKDRKEFNGSVWPGKCAFPDFTRPETRAWWGDLYKDFMEKGVDGVWNDMNEPSVFDGPDGTMPEDNHHRGGGDLLADSHLRYHDVYGMLMIRASREGIMKVNPDKRPFILSRSGYLGSHRYGATWTGDNSSTEEYMKMSVPMSLNLGLSGQPFSGPDLGGFTGNATPGLFGQWIATGTFFPFMRGHASDKSGNKEPWAFGTEIENVSRTALNRRYRLLPYFYTLFKEASETGMPVMRPVFFADVKDTTLRKEDQAFLVGNDLLIIPKWAVNPILPKGIWRTASIVGEHSETDKYQPDVKVRGGAIIPMGKIIQNTTEYKLDSLTLVVVPDKKGEARGRLYEDAGDGFRYTKGDYLISGFTAKQESASVKAVIKRQEGKRNPGTRYYKVIVITDKGIFAAPWTKNTNITIPLTAQNKVN